MLASQCVIWQKSQEGKMAYKAKVNIEIPYCVP
jgi:hypothetical protein